MANVNSGLNAFNVIKDITGPTPNVETIYIDDKQRYEITFAQDGDLLAARTANHPNGAIGSIDFIKADKNYEFDFELSSVIIDTDPASSSKVLKFTFYDYNHNSGGGKKRAGPLFNLKFTLKNTGVVDASNDATVTAVIDRELVNNSSNEVISYYTYNYGGQATALIELVQNAIASGDPIKLRMSTTSGDETNGFAMKKV